MTGQGGIFRLTCSYPELTEDHVLTSAYVKILRTVTRNAVNKSVLHVLRTYSMCSYPGYQDTTTYAALQERNLKRKEFALLLLVILRNKRGCCWFFIVWTFQLNSKWIVFRSFSSKSGGQRPSTPQKTTKQATIKYILLLVHPKLVQIAKWI